MDTCQADSSRHMGRRQKLFTLITAMSNTAFMRLHTVAVQKLGHLPSHKQQHTTMGSCSEALHPLITAMSNTAYRMHNIAHKCSE
jgi:hypothetical protein